MQQHMFLLYLLLLLLSVWFEKLFSLLAVKLVCVFTLFCLCESIGGEYVFNVIIIAAAVVVCLISKLHSFFFLLCVVWNCLCDQIGLKYVVKCNYYFCCLMIGGRLIAVDIMGMMVSFIVDRVKGKLLVQPIPLVIQLVLELTMQLRNSSSRNLLVSLLSPLNPFLNYQGLYVV